MLELPSTIRCRHSLHLPHDYYFLLLRWSVRLRLPAKNPGPAQPLGFLRALTFNSVSNHLFTLSGESGQQLFTKNLRTPTQGVSIDSTTDEEVTAVKCSALEVIV